MSKKSVPSEVVIVDETNTDSSSILKSPTELLVAQAARRSSSVGTSDRNDLHRRVSECSESLFSPYFDEILIRKLTFSVVRNWKFLCQRRRNPNEKCIAFVLMYFVILNPH
jgi:hypothetical protein